MTPTAITDAIDLLLAGEDGAAPGWDLSCAEWWDRLVAGQTPISPRLPLYGDRGEAAVRALKMLRVADLPGTPTMEEVCGEWFFDITRTLFGSTDPVTRQRAIREVFVLVPKKNSKTSYTALLMLVALLLNTRPMAEFFFLAPVQKTAEMAFSQAAGAVRLDPVLEAKLHVRDHLKEIVHRVTGASMKIITFDPETTTGMKVSGGVMIDELHVIAKSGKAAAALGQITGGMGPFPDAFCLYTTTQSDEPPVGVFAAKLKQAREIRDGKRRGRMLPVLFEFPEAMQLDRARPWMRPEFWRCVTPNLGRSVHLAGLAEDSRVALETSEEEFRRWASQHLNIQIGLAMHAHAWAGTRYWEAAGQVVELRGREGLDKLLEMSEVVTGGIDGGGLDDLLGLAFLGREPPTSDHPGRWLHWCHAWVQRDVLEMRKSEAPAFLDFEADGDLTIIDMPGQDVEELADLCEYVDASGLLDRFGVDQAGISAIVEALIARGIALDRIVGVPQGWKLVGAIKTTERKLKSGELVHGATRLMAYSAGNAKALPRGNAMMIDKQTCGTAKIDPLMALFDAVTLMTMDPKPRRKDYDILFA